MKSLQKTMLAISLLLVSSACARWEDHEKDDFKKQCMQGAARESFMRPEQYCDCMLEKLMVKYPNPDDMREQMSPDELAAFALTCADSAQKDMVVWLPEVEKAFSDSCLSMAQREQKNQPEQYCSCVLENVKKQFKTSEELAKIDTKAMQAIGSSCE